MISNLTNGLFFEFVNGWQVAIENNSGSEQTRFVKAEVYNPTGKRTESSSYTADDLAHLLRRISEKENCDG